jgi:hypothetical protein
MNADGTVLVFDVGENPLGQNADGNYEIFIVNVDGTNPRQLTNSTGGLTIEPSVSADGSIITFASNADLLGRPPGGGRDIFVINSDGTGLRQLTAAVGGSNSSNPYISGDGAIITFHSYSDITGDNPAGTPEVFIVRPDGTALRRLTDSPAGGSAPTSINADGSVIAFGSHGDPAGENPEHNWEVFTIDSDGTGLQQITHSIAGTGDFASITADGSMIVFRSNADLVGQNPDGNFELFLAVMAGANTPVGSNVTVSLNGGLGTIGGIQLTFSQVTAAGFTTVVTSSGGPPPPTGLKIVGIGGQPAYYDLNTTATFSATVTVCIRYDDAQVHGPESKLKLMHYDGTAFVNTTTSLDIVNNVICGTATALSPFAIVEPQSAPPPAVGGIVKLPEAAGAGFEDSRSSAPNAAGLAGLATAALLVLVASAWYARRRWLT